MIQEESHVVLTFIAPQYVSKQREAMCGASCYDRSCNDRCGRPSSTDCHMCLTHTQSPRVSQPNMCRDHCPNMRQQLLCHYYSNANFIAARWLFSLASCSPPTTCDVADLLYNLLLLLFAIWFMTFCRRSLVSKKQAHVVTLPWGQCDTRRS